MCIRSFFRWLCGIDEATREAVEEGCRRFNPDHIRSAYDANVTRGNWHFIEKQKMIAKWISGEISSKELANFEQR